MQKLSLEKYAMLCILGAEIAYTVCMTYGVFLRGSSSILHSALFEMLPGYSGMNFVSWFAGALSIALWAGFSGLYIAWMHNISLEK